MALADSYISHNEFASVNDDSENMKEEIKNLRA